MTRFQQEISGQLGAYWQQSAEKEVAAAVAQAVKETTVDETGAISWKSNGSYMMDDFCEKLEFAGFPFSREATRYAREVQVHEELTEYRKNYRGPSASEMDEMRKAFGEGATVVDVISGATVQL
jgi:hypothetical protein